MSSEKHKQTDRNIITDCRNIDKSQLSPMYQHYVEVKEQYPNALLLYRVGDFFECFFQDAVTIARELELVQTSKEGGKELGRVAMTGVPHHALERYSTMLVEKGYAVAICDQVEDAATAAAEKRNLVKREIQKLLTPGTLTDDGMLQSRINNFLAGIVVAGEHWGLAYADISTGEFFTVQSSGLNSLTLELLRLQPSEVLIPANAPDVTGLLRPGEKSEYLADYLPDSFCYSLRSQQPFTLVEASQRLKDTFGVTSLEGMGCAGIPLGVRAAGGLLEYVEDTQKAYKVPLQPLRTYSLADYLILDHQTRRNLEITQTIRDNTFHGSLLWAVDRTSTAMGGRALRRWILQPLVDIKGIAARQDTITELVENTSMRQDLRSMLRKIYDIERLSGRVGAGTANARDLLALSESLIKLSDLSAIASFGSAPYLKALHKVPPDLEELGVYVVERLVDSPPQLLKEGGIIKDGVDSRLDELRQRLEDDKQWLTNLEVTERERVGVANIKVGYNKTFGYYISMPRSKASQAPENYKRKQTLTNEERYITSELKERETRILTAKDDLSSLEYDIFTELRGKVAEKAQEIRSISKAVAAIDVLAGLAEVAVYQNYSCPEIVKGREINIIDGRHPVVEQSLGEGFFVPNSAKMGSENPDLIILTGPNASVILLDEIGRGTATFDGLSIAWAVAEYLATDIQGRTIFATHYHELNELASILTNVANYQVTVKEMADKIIFLHQVTAGGASKSYGIEAGRLAGLPASVIGRARQVMGQIEKHSKIALGLRTGIKQIQPKKDVDGKAIEQLDIFED